MENNLEAERSRIIAERKAAIYKLAGKPTVEARRIQNEFIAPLNERLLQINRRLGL